MPGASWQTLPTQCVGHLLGRGDRGGAKRRGDTSLGDRLTFSFGTSWLGQKMTEVENWSDGLFPWDLKQTKNIGVLKALQKILDLLNIPGHQPVLATVGAVSELVR